MASLTVEQAYTRYVLRVDPSLPRDDLAAPLDDASIELGAVYRSAAVLGPDEDDGALLVDPRLPGGRPGTRAPHLPVERDGIPASVLDVLGDGFVLLAGPTGQAWCDAAAAVADDLGVPLTAYRVAPDGALVDRGLVVPGRLRDRRGRRRPRAPGRRHRAGGPPRRPTDPRAEVERGDAAAALPLGAAPPAAPADRAAATAGRPPGRRRPPSRTPGCRR